MHFPAPKESFLEEIDTIAEGEYVSVARRLVSSFGASILGPAITAVVQIVNVPVMLRTWGPEMYGEWLLLSTIPTYLLLSDLGFGNVAGTDMTLRVHAGDRDGALETFQSSQVLVLLVSLTISLVLVALLILFPLQRTLHLSSLSVSESRATLILLSANCLVLLQWSVIMAGYRSTERYALGMLWVNCIRIVEGASVFVVLFTHARPPQLAALMLLISVAGTVWLLFDLRRRTTWLSFGLQFARWQRIQELWRPAAAFMAIPAGNAISTQGTTMLVGVVMGPMAVAVYNPMRTLARVVLQLSNAVSNSFWPELSAAFGQNNLALARKLHRSACQVALLLAFFSMIALAILGPRIFAVWTHGRIVMDTSAYYMLLLSAGVYSAWSASAAVPLAANRHQRLALIYLICTAASLFVAYFLLKAFGLIGPALAAVLCDVAMTATVMGISNRMLGDKWPDFTAGVMDPAAIVLIGAKLRGFAKRL